VNTSSKLRLFPFIAGHDAAHELVEERDGKGGVAVARAPNHAFGNQLAARWGEVGDLAAELVGDVAGAMRASAQLGHRTEVTFFQRGQAVKAHTEETFVEGSDSGLGGQLDIVQGDGRGDRGIPGMLTPLLELQETCGGIYTKVSQVTTFL